MSLITKHYPDRIEVLAYKNTATECAVSSKFNKINLQVYCTATGHHLTHEKNVIPFHSTREVIG